MKSRIYAILRERMVDGQLEAGQRLIEADLATQFGTSKTPVREALLRLEGERLVTIIPHVGAQVTEMSTAELRELLFIKDALEFAALDRIVERISVEDLALSGALVSEMGTARRSQDWKRYRAAQRELHALFIRASGFSTLADMLLSLDDLMDRYFRLFIAREPTLWDQDLQANLDRFEAISRRDADSVIQYVGKWHRHLALLLEEPTATGLWR